MGTLREQYELSFNAHLNLVTIHPWVDGNGRTARLLMNYIQFCYHLFRPKYLKKIEKNIFFPCANVRMKKLISRFGLYGKAVEEITFYRN